jgi:hypothetical protein
MRVSTLALTAALALAGCGGDTENKTKAASAQSIVAGQYEVTAEVAEFRQTDQGTPKINAPVGTRTTRNVCVPPGGAIMPDLFADEGMSCQVGSSDYVRNGTINLTLRCTRPGTEGNINYVLSGTFDANGYQADRELTSLFVGEGDVFVYTRVQGRRTGDCAPGAPAGNSAAPAATR